MDALRKIIFLTLAMFAMVAASPQLNAQRRVTPVEPAPGTKGTTQQEPATPAIDPSRLQEQRDASGNIIFVDTVTGQEWVDTTIVKKNTKMIYPKIYCVAAGLNIWDPVMRIFGQDYGVASIWGELNMHNRYFPTLEIGLGQANITPEEMNFTFKSGMAPYFKIGASYNVFYNSDPRYKFLVGLRYGFSSFSYRVTDVTVTDSYWGTTSTFDIPRQNATVGYLDVLAGVRVNIFSNFSLGWDLRFHKILHESKATYGKPMYIPGYGKRGAALTGSFSLVYTFQLNRPASDGVIKDSETTPNMEKK
ncbi:MAG: DUF6048 family protein [Firmicutes bacterium]|nr:DUF6048 family protein [Bacillota bacterium]MCM1401461.1 DUF6048 family protein [Bacteroides sp.]MCM1476819.1 DUF6048 family protein [Bacteroides sp.]